MIHLKKFNLERVVFSILDPIISFDSVSMSVLFDILFASFGLVKGILHQFSESVLYSLA